MTVCEFILRRTLQELQGAIVMADRLGESGGDVDDLLRAKQSVAEQLERLRQKAEAGRTGVAGDDQRAGRR